MALTRRTMLDVVTNVRDDLDEPYDATGNSNFWSQADIVRRINKGLRWVWQVARNDKGSRWHVRRLLSTDPVVTIYGEPYNPAAFGLVENRTELILPPDLGELLMLEPLPTDASTSTADIRFRWKSGPQAAAFREQTRVSSGLSEYEATLVQRLTGPRVLFRPPFQSSSVDLQLEYIVKPGSYALTDTFEGLGFDDIALDAVEAFAVVACRRKADNAARLKEAENAWTEAKALVIEAVGPLQTVEHEFAEGFMPDGNEW